MTKDEAREAAHVLVELGDALAAMQKKVYVVAKERVQNAARRLRFMLKVEGDDEKRSG